MKSQAPNLTQCKFAEVSHKLKEIVCIVKEEVLYNVCNDWDKMIGASSTTEGCLIGYLYHEFCLNLTVF